MSLLCDVIYKQWIRISKFPEESERVGSATPTAPWALGAANVDTRTDNGLAGPFVSADFYRFGFLIY